MSDRKEENFDFESDMDDELFSGTDKKGSARKKASDDDLDLLDDDEHEQEIGKSETTDSQKSDSPQGAADEHLDEGEFSDLGGLTAHAEEDFGKDAFDPSSLGLENESHTEEALPEESGSKGFQGLVEKVKEGWPYYLGAGCAIIFGIYLVSVILSGTSSEQAKAKKAAESHKVSNTRPLGLTLQDTTQFKGTLDVEKKEKDAKDAALIDSTLANLPTMTQDDAAGTITMDKEDMAKLLQGFSQVVNTSVEKISTGVTKELSEAKNIKEQSSANNADEMKRISKSIDMLVERIDQYEQKIVQLDGTLNQLSVQLNLLVAQKTAQTDNLTLRAVVPGRAWLVDSQGRTYTVAEGDAVGNFGKIIQIDANAGRVVTSSGYVFN